MVGTVNSTSEKDSGPILAMAEGEGEEEHGDDDDASSNQLSMALQSFVGPWPLFQFLNAIQSGRTPWTGDQPVARPLPTHRTTQTQNKGKQTSMP
jgi:hypothetical protein